MKKYFTIISITLLGTPAVVFAAPRNLTELMKLFVDLLDQAVVVVGALALLFFFWGLSQLLLNSDNEDKKKASKSIMVWGIIILFVMFSIGGILKVLDNTFFAGSAGESRGIGNPSQPGFIGSPAPGTSGSGGYFQKDGKTFYKGIDQGGKEREGEVRTIPDNSNPFPDNMRI
jgi:hypothetical protein